jgi:RNA polymerase sigma-70 factor (ECF subfamily)
VAIGEILEPFRSYLTLLARIQIGKRLQSKADPADVVQEVFLDAFKQFPGFRGETEDAVSGWLLRILAGHLARLIRRYFVTEARNVRLEVSIERELDSSTDRLARDFASQESSPSERVRQREEVAQLADMLERLPPDYREVILLRQIEGIPLSEVAQRMGRSEDSVQKLWFRGLKALRDLMNKD